MEGTCKSVVCDDIIVLLGKPGSGRSSVGTRLAEKLGCRYLSLGTHLRETERHGGTTFARRIREADEAGELKPWWVVSHLIGDVLFDLRDNECLIMDGVGRTAEVAALFRDAVGWLGRNYRVYEITVSDEHALRRMTAPSPGNQRVAMSEEAARQKLAVYAAEEAGREVFRTHVSVKQLPAENSTEDTALAIMADLG